MGRRYRTSPSYAPERKRSSSSSSTRQKKRKRRKSDSSDSGKARKRRRPKSSKRGKGRRKSPRRRKNKRKDSSSEDEKQPSGIKLFVGRLPHEVTEQHLRSLFEGVGEVKEVFVINQAPQGGCAFVRLATVEQAHRAIQELHDKPAPTQALYTPLQVTLAKGESQRLGLEETSLEARKQELQHFALSAGLLPVRDLIDLVKDGLRSSSGFKQKWMSFCEWSESQGVKTTNPSKHPAVALSTFVGTVAMDFGHESWFRSKFKHLPFASAPAPVPGGHPLPPPPLPGLPPGVPGLAPHALPHGLPLPHGMPHGMPPPLHGPPGYPGWPPGPGWNPSGMPPPPSNIFRPGGPSGQGGSIFRPWGPPPDLTSGVSAMVMRTSRSDPEKDEYSEDSESEDVRPIEKNTKVSSRRVRAGVEASGIVVHDNQGPTDVDALSEDTDIEAVTI